MEPSARDRYESGLRWSIRLLGIDGSIERKVLAAVAIQFLVSVGQAVVPFVVTGAARAMLTGGLFVGAAVAFANTVLLTRADIVEPVRRLERTAAEIADGRVDVAVAGSDRPDEVGTLTESFASMESHLTLVARQADALADQEFEAGVLDETVPGTFGASLSRMADSLREYTAELEATTADLERRSRRLERLVEAVDGATERAADGDLTATLDTDAVAGDDEGYRQICENYNRLVGTLGATLAEVRGFADDVSGASEEVAASMDELDDASEDVAVSIQEISAGATSQTEQFDAVAAEMNDLSATVEEIAASADEVADTAARAAERGESGREAAKTAIDALDDLEERVETVASAVEELAERVGAVDDVVSFIDEMAEQTNMLALNASIEAARVDGDGDGFAVVADEVKSLAEETRDAAEEAGVIVADLQRDAADTAATVREMHAEVGASVDTIEGALADFEDILSVVAEVNDSVQEVSDVTDRQAETTQEVVAHIDDVTAISERTTDEADTVAGAAQQQSAAVSRVTDDVGTVADRAADLRESLDEFRLPEGGGVSPEPGATGHAPAAPTDD